MKLSKKVARRILNGLARTLTGLTCDIDATDLSRIPLSGPFIIIVNHVNFLELPVIYPRIPSDLGVGFSKVESWDNPIFRLLFANWDMIPIERGKVDVTAIRRGLAALEAGKILFITPEGTRSHHGRLQRGKPGVVLIARHSNVPIWPVACYGGEVFKQNLKHLHRTEYHVKVGHPFQLDTADVQMTSSIRQQVVDEMMYQIAALLPARYRGVYSDLETATELFLEFLPPARSNLPQARSAPMLRSASQS